MLLTSSTLRRRYDSCRAAHVRGQSLANKKPALRRVRRNFFLRKSHSLGLSLVSVGLGLLSVDARLLLLDLQLHRFERVVGLVVVGLGLRLLQVLLRLL